MSSKIKNIFYLIITLLFIAFPQKVEAAFSYTIDSISATTISDKEQVVSATLIISDLPSGDSYFRIGIDEGNSYVGYNKIGNDWIKLTSLSEDETNKTCSRYFKINLDGTYIIDFKVGSDVDIVNGEHVLKAHRFRSTCTIDTLKPETAITISLATPTPTPTIAPTVVPSTTPTITPTPTPIKTVTPTVTASPKPTPTKTATAAQTPSTTEDEQQNNEEKSLDAVLGESTALPEIDVKDEKKKFPLISILFLASGTIVLGYVSYMIYNLRHASSKKDS